MFNINLGEKYGNVVFNRSYQSPRERIEMEKKEKSGSLSLEDQVDLFVKCIRRENGDPAFSKDELLDDGVLFDKLDTETEAGEIAEFEERKKKLKALQKR